jgi:hypothetical protein
MKLSLSKILVSIDSSEKRAESILWSRASVILDLEEISLDLKEASSKW